MTDEAKEKLQKAIANQKKVLEKLKVPEAEKKQLGLSFFVNITVRL